MSENSNPVEQGPGRLAGEKDKKRQGERIDQFPLLHWKIPRDPGLSAFIFANLFVGQ